MARRSLVEQLRLDTTLPWWLYLVVAVGVARTSLEFAGFATRSQGWQQVGNAAFALVLLLAAVLSVVTAVEARRRHKGLDN